MSEQNKNLGTFASFVLLSEPNWDSRQFVKDLKDEWSLDFAIDEDTDTLVEKFGDGFIAVSLMPAPIPDGEADDYAKANYMWPEAESVTKSHKAHLLIAVTGAENNLIDTAKMITKITDVCLKQKNAVAVYADGAVYEPEFYHIVAQSLHDEALPILDWVWFGICRNGDVPGIYTYGMRKFGKEEIEVYADAPLGDIRDFVLSMASYVLEYDVTLNDGETIGFSEEQKLPITLSKGIALSGESLKIAYPGK